MSVHSLDFTKSGFQRAGSGLPTQNKKDMELSVKDMSPNRFNPREQRATLSVRPVPATGSAKNISGGFSLRMEKAHTHQQLMDNTRKPRPAKDFISAFDDQFKVDLNPDQSPSISRMSQSNIKRAGFIQDTEAIRRKTLAYVIGSLWILLIGTNVLLDLGFLDVKKSVLYQWANDFPFIILSCIIGYYLAHVALKTFKHN